MKVYESFRKGLAAVLKTLCVVLFAALVLLVLYQVIARQIFNTGTAWTEPAGRYCFVWMSLFGAALVIGENDDVAIDFLVRKFPPAAVKVVEVLAHAIVGGFAIWIMVWGGLEICSSTWDLKVELMPFTKGQSYLVIPLAGALIAMYSLMNIFEVLRKPVDTRTEDELDISEIQEEGI